MQEGAEPGAKVLSPSAEKVRSFMAMEATVTELRQQTGKVLSAIEKGKTVIITERGKPKARIAPVSPRDKAAAAKALRAIGPIHFLPRK